MKSNKKSFKLIMFLVSILFLLGVSSTQAAKVIYSGSVATGIKNMGVNGTYYNVEFVWDSADSVYGNPANFTFDNKQHADTALEAVRSALNSVSAVTDVGPTIHPSLLIGYEENEVFGTRFAYSRQSHYINGSWTNSGFDTDESDDTKSYAVFTTTQSPECTDSDGDGYAVEGGACGAVDCNDNDSQINPNATEVCDDIDNNCNSVVDGNRVCEYDPTTVVYSGDSASSITNLIVNSTTYGVEFQNNSANSIYGTPPAFTFNNKTDASAAVEAIITALNGVPAVKKVGASGVKPAFLVAYADREIFGTSFTDAWQSHYIDSTWVNTDFDTDESDDIKMYAVFTDGSDLPTLLTQTQVSQLYVSIFGRACEGEGNAYWRSEQDNMAAAADVMLQTGAAESYFGSALNDNQLFIALIYENTLGKTIAEDPDGINYWAGELNNGKSKGTVVAALITAATDSQFSGTAAQEQFNNKVEVCNYVADNISSVPDANDLSAFVGFIYSVTDDPSTVVAAKATVDESGLAN